MLFVPNSEPQLPLHFGEGSTVSDSHLWHAYVDMLTLLRCLTELQLHAAMTLNLTLINMRQWACLQPAIAMGSGEGEPNEGIGDMESQWLTLAAEQVWYFFVDSHEPCMVSLVSFD